ncbi:MAG TPA: chlorite dismutase family protein [bacterium]|nr:chlorite dismutase family protein [bacterium]
MALAEAKSKLSVMQPTPTGFGIWSGGCYMHFGQDIGTERLRRLVRHAYEQGIRTFMTADVYGEGEADKVLGEALSCFERDSYSLIGLIGHDFYKGNRQGEKGFPRLTDPALRRPAEFGSYLEMAARKSLQRLQTDHFDLLLLHNPDSVGYTHEAVWQGLADLKTKKLTGLLGVAPGPANGFTLDLIRCFEKFGSVIDWAMIILNPLEPWPGSLVLPAAEKYEVKVIARVVEYGGLFHDSLKPGMPLTRQDHRAFRPQGWIEAAQEKLNRFREIASEHEMTLLQLACQWALSQKAVACVIPTLIQEASSEAKRIESEAEELARVASCRSLSLSAIDEISKLGDNRNSMSLKGASPQYQGKPQADQWPMNREHEETAKRWGIVPDRDLYYANDPRDLREIGMPRNGIPQTSQRRLFLQLQVFAGCSNPSSLISSLKASGLESVLYLDVNHPQGAAVLILTENPDSLVQEARGLFLSEPFKALRQKPELTMTGRTYSAGREADLEDWLLWKPRRSALNPEWPWAIWYPLRRKPEFELLSKQEQAKILMEHAMIGRNFGQAGYAADIRLACHGLDQRDNEFVLGLVGPELYPLSRLVQEMRKTQQTAKYIQSLGPFFVGKAVWQSPAKSPS